MIFSLSLINRLKLFHGIAAFFEAGTPAMCFAELNLILQDGVELKFIFWLSH
jgi:hypothetical protein